MYKIGEFSILAKTTIKTLRYYEKENLLIPSYVDKETGYRFYDSKELITLAKIISLRQIGLSIKDIKKVLNMKDIKEILNKRKEDIEKELNIHKKELSKINYLLEGKEMENEIIVKELPDYTVYYKEGVIEDFSKITEFILSSADECLKTNPNMKCIEPGYCYVSYLDGEYKEKNIKIRYSQAVEESGIENETIKFEKLKPIKGICIYHKGSYSSIGKAYSKVLDYIEKNNYEICEPIRESYIDGIWNKENEEDYLTEIQVPVKEK